MKSGHPPLQRIATFRFYEELNDFLPPAQRKRAFSYTFTGTPSVKDAIEALGVPHTEVDLILVDGASVGFDGRLVGGERVAVYPTFERFDITPLHRLRARPLRESRFILDVHLGKLARYVRMLGFDALYRNDFEDQTLIDLAAEQRRIILTRDRGILKHNAVTHGYWLRADQPQAQLREVVVAFDLARQCRPFTRCMDCNGALHPVEKHAVLHRLPPGVQEDFDAFAECEDCGKIYWAGSHYDRMRAMIEDLLADPAGESG